MAGGVYGRVSLEVRIRGLEQRRFGTHGNVGAVAADGERKHEQRQTRALGLAVERELRQAGADCGALAHTSTSQPCAASRRSSGGPRPWRTQDARYKNALIHPTT